MQYFERDCICHALRRKYFPLGKIQYFAYTLVPREIFVEIFLGVNLFENKKWRRDLLSSIIVCKLEYQFYNLILFIS